MEESSNITPAEKELVDKLLAFAKTKNILTWDEIEEYLGRDFINSDEKMEPVLNLLKDIGREPVETDIIGVDDDDGPLVGDDEDDDIMLEQDDDDLAETDETVSEIEQAEKLASQKSRLVNSDKDSNVDDPIRLYLREIGKESLLTA